MTPHDLEAALASVPDITRIEIQIVGTEFRWSLFEASSAEFVGEFRLGKGCEGVI
jgi:hypothetical protein